MKWRVKWIACVLLLASCKQDPSTSTGPSTSTSTSTSASASSSASAATVGPITYRGSYTATPGALYVPDGGEWGGVKFRGDDAGALGEGTITLTIDRDAGTLSGELQGPLGPATLGGVAQDDSLTFHVAPRNPSDLAFSGTGTGAIKSGSATGELHVSSWRANVLRDATFSASTK